MTGVLVLLYRRHGVLACWVSIAMGASVGALTPLLQFISMRALTAVLIAAAVSVVLVVVALYDFMSVIVSIHTDGLSNFPDLPDQVPRPVCCAARRQPARWRVLLH